MSITIRRQYIVEIQHETSFWVQVAFATTYSGAQNIADIEYQKPENKGSDVRIVMESSEVISTLVAKEKE